MLRGPTTTRDGARIVRDDRAKKIFAIATRSAKWIRLAASVMTATTKRAAKVRGMTRQAGSSRGLIGHRSTVPMNPTGRNGAP